MRGRRGGHGGAPKPVRRPNPHGAGVAVRASSPEPEAAASASKAEYEGKPQFLDPTLEGEVSWNAVMTRSREAAANGTVAQAQADALFKLNPETVYGLLDSGVVLDVATDAGVSDMADIVGIVDEHVRMVFDAIVRGNDAGMATRCYAALDNLPPMLGSQQRAAKAALGGAALEELREEAELTRTVIDEALGGDAGVPDTDDDETKTADARRERDAAACLVAAVDAVLARLPFEGKTPMEA